MHMRIRYHFLADLHVTRHVRETEYEKRFRHTLNKPCSVELVQAEIVNIDPRSYQNTHFFIYH